VFATARPKRTVNHFFDNIPADALILHNGAVVYAEDTLLGNYGIESGLKDKILLEMNKDYLDTTISVEIDDVLYANFDVSTVWNNTESVRTDFTNIPDKPADKIIVGLDSQADIERFSKYLTDDLYIEIADGKLGMIMNRKATKCEAIRLVAEYFNISTSEVVAFGDDYNDIEMLRGCGIGVAVTNAIDEAKAVADYICDTNDNYGVAKWLEENVC
jgi:Cof subfamily protein (haloacid dehalogenase superfamily)